MAIEEPSAAQQVRDAIDQLKRPVPELSTLLVLLCSPLDNISLLPPRFRRYNTSPLPSGSFNIPKHLPSIQTTLIDNILPNWEPVLVEENALELLDQYFCPDSFSFASASAGEVALSAYSTILSQPLTIHSINLLSKLVTRYPIDRLHAAIILTDSRDNVTLQAIWEDTVRNVVAVPAKVANAIAGKGPIPSVLEQGVYYNNIAIRTEELVASFSSKESSSIVAPLLSYLISKLVNVGVFPNSEPASRSEASFWKATNEAIRLRLKGHSKGYATIWNSVLLGLPTSISLKSVLKSLIASLRPPTSIDDINSDQRGLIKREVNLLDVIVGHPSPDQGDLWEVSLTIATERDWHVGYARIFVCWISGGISGNPINQEVVNDFLSYVVDLWSSPMHIKHSLLSRHQYLTALLLVSASYLQPSSPYIQSLAFSPSFISGVGNYIGHPDQSVRRCGMLAAEVVAQLSGKKLDFRDWDGEEPGQEWARSVRTLISERDVDADATVMESKDSRATNRKNDEEGVTTSPSTPEEATLVMPTAGYDSDDSMTGYGSPPSSGSVSPAPEELEEIANDPTLNVGKKKVARPVYLAQLGELLRNTGGQKASDDPHEADKIEMALDYAEELIRRKRSYGTELEENTVNLVYGLIGLQDNYEIDGFDDKRQDALTALVACCPQKSAPCMIEEFFKNQYSMTQRYAAMNALALGARELASLPVPISRVDPARITFPSKHLPDSLHQRYLTAADVRNGAVPAIMDSISDRAIENGKEGMTAKVPELVRERKLRIGQRPGISEVSSPSAKLSRLDLSASVPSKTTFTEVATEFFIAPMINRFWLFLRDEQTREERTAHLSGRQRYHGAGTGLVLNPVILSHFLRTLAVLVDAGQHAPEWLAIVAPDSLELAVTVGTRPISHMEIDEDVKQKEKEQALEGPAAKEAAVLTSCLELALVVLDGCLEIDGGRVLGLEHTTMLLGASEWATEVFNALDKGLKMEGGGGAHEKKLKRTAAGVVLKIDELTSKWRRSMLDTR